jgi:hypothetical protein
MGSLDVLEGLLVHVGYCGIDASLDMARHGTHLIGEGHPIGDALARKDIESQKVCIMLCAGVSDAAQQVVQVDIACCDD